MYAPPLWLVILWSLFVLQAWLSAAQARKFLRSFRESRHTNSLYTPKVTVIVPFKGVDHEMESGIRRLCEQNYPTYSLRMVVQSEDDAAYPILLRELARYPQRQARVLVAGEASPTEGQKVHNQLFALRDIYDNTPDQDVWVFADSDAIPGPEWLRHLVGPLAQSKKTGLTTGYRWLIPSPASSGQIAESPAIDGSKPTIWSHLASLMNGSVAMMLGRDEWNHAWGGSMAIRADIARQGRLRDRLAGALCDDYQFTRLSRDLGLRVYFVPQCLVATPVSFDCRGMFNFGHRQYLLTRVYAPRVFLTGLLLTSLYVAGFTSLVAYLLWCVAHGWTKMPWIWPVVALVLAAAGDQFRALFRRRAVRLAFGEKTVQQLRPTLRLDQWATPWWMLMHWMTIVRSAFGRTMRWRGILYRLDGPQRCERLTL